jgi:hypothetical protein
MATPTYNEVLKEMRALVHDNEYGAARKKLKNWAGEAGVDTELYMATASVRFGESPQIQPEKENKPFPPKDIPDIDGLELYQWAAWMELEKWDYQGCYHSASYTKEAFTGISRATKQPVKNSFNKETWEQVGNTTQSRATLATSAVEVFIRYLKRKYAHSRV